MSGSERSCSKNCKFTDKLKNKMAWYTITIKVRYDDETEPENMKDILAVNLDRCIDREGLLNDPEREAIIDEWTGEVENE